MPWGENGATIYEAPPIGASIRYLSDPMDNLAHSLVGAAIGRAVGAGRVPYAGLLGAIAANAPDWTEFLVDCPLAAPRYLECHRGITHSLAGAAVEIVALTALLVVVMRWLARARQWEQPGTGVVLGLVAASVASHPLMDWQGSYGLRPFLPWSDRWYYGDIVAIVDALFWIVPLVALAWTGRRHWLPLAWYGTIWIATTAIIFLSGLASPLVKIDWILLSVLGVIGWLWHWFGPSRVRLVTTGALVVLLGHATAQAAWGTPVKARLRREAAGRFGPTAQWAALTIAGRPFAWDPMMAGADTIAGPGWAVPRHLHVPVVQRVIRETEGGRAIARFARFLAAEVDSSTTPWRVQLRDVRYTRHGGNGWAAVTVVAPP